MTTSVACTARHLAVCAATAGSAGLAAGSAPSGNKACDRLPTSTPTPNPSAMAVLIAGTRAWSATPATGITVKAITTTIASGLPLRRPMKNTVYSSSAVNTSATLA